MTFDKHSLRVTLGAAILCSAAWAQSTTRMSVSSLGNQSVQLSTFSSISADGRYVAFDSAAENFLPSWNGHRHIYVHDRVSGETTLVSADSSGAQGNGTSTFPSISADGRYVAFTSGASNLVPGDTNGLNDIFVRDRLTGQTTRVSVDSSGAQADGYSLTYLSSISADGNRIVFLSHATNLVASPTDGNWHTFVHDRSTGQTILVSVSSSGTPEDGISEYPTISADGRYAGFTSDASNLVTGDTNGFKDVFVHDLTTGQTVRASVDSANGEVGGDSFNPSLSADGRFVAFISAAGNLVTGDTNFKTDIFVHDMVGGATTRVSVTSSGMQATGDSGTDDFVSISADGRFVAFNSVASDLVAGDTNHFSDVFVHDRLSGQTTRASVSSSGVQGSKDSSASSISADGRLVAFSSNASNLVSGDTNNITDIFVRDLGAWTSFTPICFGDGSLAACPCLNFGLGGHGCENSAATGGAVLSGAGSPSLAADTVSFTASGELPTALSILAQGRQVITPVAFGDGLRCVAGSLKRMYVKTAVAGSITAPQAGDPTVSERSAALGDTITFGSSRYYYAYYRDASAGFCPRPLGDTFNSTNSVAVVWSP